MSDRRDDLQRAAEYYSVAIRAWEVCGEHAKARVCRCDLATSALVPLGRYDEALAEMNVVLGASDLTEAEHAWMMLTHGFVLVNANRIPLAESRFERVAELGHVQANPRLAAAAAWGRALVAVRRDDLGSDAAMGRDGREHRPRRVRRPARPALPVRRRHRPRRAR